MAAQRRVRWSSSLVADLDFIPRSSRNAFRTFPLQEWIVLKTSSPGRVNVLNLPFTDAQFDVLIASRLFTILPDRARAVAEMYRVLKPGGRCFIAEPRYTIWASIPLFAMWLLASMTHSGNGYREPRKATVFSAIGFERIFSSQPWKRVKTWQDGRYQYALCEKD